MRARIFIGAVLIIASFGCGIFASGKHRHGTAQQWAIAYLLEPALVGSAIAQGPVLFVHDADRMARGEPCTSVRMLEPLSGSFEEVASFRCIRRPGTLTNHFTLTAQRQLTDGIGCVLTAYQFAGDPEIHGVPMTATAH